MEKALKAMAEEGDDGELTVEGREAWYGLERTSIAVVYSLLRLCLLHLQRRGPFEEGVFMPDETLKCVDCQADWILTEKEKEFFLGKKLNLPKRCKPCREAKKQARRSQGN